MQKKKRIRFQDLPDGPEEEKVNSLLKNLEPYIVTVVGYYPEDFKSEIAQEIRIKLWKIICTTYENEEVSPTTIPAILAFCRSYISGIASLSYKALYRIKANYYSKHYDISTLSLKNVSTIDSLEFEMDFGKYEKILTEREFELWKYICDTEQDLDNFHDISRQFGYTGRGAMKYNLISIAEKIRSHNKKKDNMT